MKHKTEATAEATASAGSAACDCETDPIACLQHMFVDQVQGGRIKRGQSPARRPVFLRLHGALHGRLDIVPGLPADLRVGIFGQRDSYSAWVRYSSDLPDGLPDLKSTVGIGIKLFGVQGDKVLPPEEAAVTADFLMQNINVFFVDNARDMCAFTQASLAGTSDAWLKDHPKTQAILDAME